MVPKPGIRITDCVDISYWPNCNIFIGKIGGPFLMPSCPSSVNFSLKMLISQKWPDDFVLGMKLP